MKSSDTKRAEALPRHRRMTALASALALAGSLGATLVAGQLPAAANCDFPADIKISDASVFEGTGGGFLQFTWLKFTVTNTGTNATSVDWTTRDGPPYPMTGWAAKAPGDYTAASGTLQLDGSPKAIYVFVTRDAVHEPNEMMHVRLYNPKGCWPVIADGTGIGRIFDDD
jgi:hypothetical protein